LLHTSGRFAMYSRTISAQGLIGQRHPEQRSCFVFKQFFCQQSDGPDAFDRFHCDPPLTPTRLLLGFRYLAWTREGAPRKRDGATNTFTFFLWSGSPVR